ncbi:uncharacterized protein [Cherax quadricarinatus]
MVTMYCYGTVFHMARATSLQRLVCATVTSPEILGGALVEKAMLEERQERLRNCRVMAVVSLSFIITITPWTLRQIIAACTNSWIPGGLDYGVWVVSVGGGVVVIFIFWLLSASFRRATEETLHNRVCCGNVYYEESEEVSLAQVSQYGGAPHLGITHAGSCPAATPRLAPLSCNATPRHLPNGRLPVAAINSAAACDLEAVGEKYWGEILERTVSSTSLQNLQRIYGNGSSVCPDLRLVSTSSTLHDTRGGSSVCPDLHLVSTSSTLHDTRGGSSMCPDLHLVRSSATLPNTRGSHNAVWAP